MLTIFSACGDTSLNRARIAYYKSKNQTEHDARIEICERLLDRLDCAGIKVAEESKPPEIEAAVVTVSDDIEPECREAYLQLKAAEKEQERARKRVAELAPNFGVAGPRGTLSCSGIPCGINAKKQ